MSASPLELEALFVRIYANADQLFASTKKVEAEVSRMVKVLNAALTGLTSAAIYAFNRFDQAVTRSLAHMREFAVGTFSDMRMAMEKGIFDIAIKTTTGVTDLAKGFDVLVSSGQSAGMALESLGIAENFAVAGGMKMEDATRRLVEIQRALGMESTDVGVHYANMTHLADAFVGLAPEVGSTTEQISSAFSGRLMSTMRQFNLTFEDTLALVGGYSRLGGEFKGAHGGQMLERAIRELASETAIPGRELQFGFKAYDASNNLKPLIQLVEEFAGKLRGLAPAEQKAYLEQLHFQDNIRSTVIPLIQSSVAASELRKKIDELGGSSQMVADMMRRSLSGQLMNIWNNITTLATAIGKQLAPAVAILAGGIRSLTTWFINLNPAVQSLIVTFSALYVVARLAFSATGLAVMAKIFSPLGALVSGVATAVGKSVAYLGSSLLSIGSFGGKLALAPFIALGNVVMALGTALWGIIRIIHTVFRVAMELVYFVIMSVFIGLGHLIRNLSAVGLLFVKITVGLIGLTAGLVAAAVTAIPLLIVGIIRLAFLALPYLQRMLLFVASLFAKTIAVIMLMAVTAVPLLIYAFLSFATIGVYKVLYGLVQLVSYTGPMVLRFFSSLASSVWSLIPSLNSVVMFVINLVSWFLTLVTVITLVTTVVATVGSGVAAIGAGMSSIWAKIMEEIPRILSGVGSTITGMWGQAKEGAADFFTGMMEGISRVVGFFWHFGDNVITIFRWVRENWLEVVSDIGRSIVALVENTTKNTLALFSSIGQVAVVVLEPFKNLFLDVISAVGNFFRDEWKNMLNDVGVLVKVFLQAFLENFKLVISSMADMMKGGELLDSMTGLFMKANARFKGAIYGKSKAEVLSEMEEIDRVMKGGGRKEATVESIIKQFKSPQDFLKAGDMKTDFGGVGKGLAFAFDLFGRSLPSHLRAAGDVWKGGPAFVNPMAGFEAKAPWMKLFDSIKTALPEDWGKKMEEYLKMLTGQAGAGGEAGQLRGSHGPGFRFQQISEARFAIGGPGYETVEWQQLTTLRSIDARLAAAARAAERQEPREKLKMPTLISE